MARSTDRVTRHTAEAAREGEIGSNPLVRGSASSASPACPKCGGKKFRPLNSSDTHQRYECSDFNCMESFAVPIAGAMAALAARKEEGEANPMAKVSKALKCDACGKAFAHQAWLEKHAGKCTGGGAPVQRKARKVAEAKLTVGSTGGDAVVTLSPRPSYIGTQLTQKDILLGQLREKLDRARKDVVELKTLIDAVEAVEVGPVPFDGSRTQRESA